MGSSFRKESNFPNKVSYKAIPSKSYRQHLSPTKKYVFFFSLLEKAAHQFSPQLQENPGCGCLSDNLLVPPFLSWPRTDFLLKKESQEILVKTCGFRKGFSTFLCKTGSLGFNSNH